MNKNWNDRADKDLFFTILSVKNIGVISGAEWTTIGNYMRGLGYGFTNEGCRQHFQGLRRAQNKNEADGSHSDSARRADPTLNPITRRPGPGRGRPRKSQASEAAQPGTNDADGTADADASPTAVPVSAPVTISPTAPTMLPVPMLPGPMVPNNSMPGQGPEMASHAMPIQQNQHPQLQSQHPHQHQFQHQHFQQLQHQSQIPPQLKEEMLKAEMSEGADSATSQDQLQLDTVQSGDEDPDEHPAKRQRLDPHDLTQDSALDDEAVLALAAHN
ncbi:hypothetical protein TRIATDRAFT_185013, partial [Trichoderma atroviride IMI 206040]